MNYSPTPEHPRLLGLRPWVVIVVPSVLFTAGAALFASTNRLALLAVGTVASLVALSIATLLRYAPRPVAIALSFAWAALGVGTAIFGLATERLWFVVLALMFIGMTVVILAWLRRAASTTTVH